MADPIRFSAPTFGANALAYLQASIASGHLDGDSPFTVACHRWLAEHYGARALLTPSCTAALELAALLAGVGPGDEVIMPSFTFTSTANAFALRGATPVFIDVREDTLNLDEALLQRALTPRTRAIVPVHYAGVGCEMDAIGDFAAAHGLMVVEDAAQAHLASYRGRKLGTFGALGCVSYHASKNVVCGEGGAIVVNDAALADHAEIIWEKGTNRKQFRDAKAAKYEWLELGSSYLPSDLQAAVLLSQFEDGQMITDRRLAIWDRYHQALAELEDEGLLRRPAPPPHVQHNGHIYHVRLPDAEAAGRLRTHLAKAEVPVHPHYVPLHSAPAGHRFGRAATPMPVTDAAGATLLRLPINATLSDDAVEHVTAAIIAAARASRR